MPLFALLPMHVIPSPSLYSFNLSNTAPLPLSLSPLISSRPSSPFLSTFTPFTCFSAFILFVCPSKLQWHTPHVHEVLSEPSTCLYNTSNHLITTLRHVLQTFPSSLRPSMHFHFQILIQIRPCASPRTKPKSCEKKRCRHSKTPGGCFPS